MNKHTKNLIDANPTKEFFIDMLTRDIRLDRAIIDLIDNCIDGAKSIRNNEDYSDLNIIIKYNTDSFEIIDNCGGFSLDVAKKYAFRFGRPNLDGVKFVKHSIGRFGVGMKRALFKLGSHFIVESKKGLDHFIVEVKVHNWLKRDDWSFEYLEHEDIPVTKKQLTDSDGTIIKIFDLHENVKSDFISNEFQSKLNREISLALSYSILKGLSISVNNSNIIRSDITLLESDDLKPLFIQKILSDVDVQVFAGIGDYSPDKAGWYIFCNDRMVLEADKSYVTGWKTVKQDEGSIVKYHNDYAMFRGAVFFDADDSKKLPMTTTKTGIDSDHAVFKSARPLMLTAMKQVVNFLKSINNKEEGELLINNSNPLKITEIRSHSASYSTKLVTPSLNSNIKNNTLAGISYYVDREVLDKVKDELGVSSNKDVGLRTFEYYVSMNDLQ